MGLNMRRQMQMKRKKGMYVQHMQRSKIAEQFREVRTNLQFVSKDCEMKSLLITSANVGEGKTTTASNLALVIAQQRKKVLLIDADLRKPSIHEMFGKSNEKGLAAYLQGQISFQDACTFSGFYHLDLLVSGPIPPNPAELLSSTMMAELLDEISSLYDIVLIDSPPLLSVSDAKILSGVCNSSVLVVQSGKTMKEDAVKARENLSEGKANFLGAILNQRNGKRRNNPYYGVQ